MCGKCGAKKTSKHTTDVTTPGKHKAQKTGHDDKMEEEAFEDAKEEDDDNMDVKEMFKTMMGRMKTMVTDVRSDVKSVCGKVDKAVSIAEEAKAQVGEVKEEMRTTTGNLQQGLTQLQSEHAQTRRQLQELQTTVKNIEESRKAISHNERDRQIVWHGFKQDTSQATIIDTINKALMSKGLDSKVEEVFTYSDPAKVGVTTFLEKDTLKIFFRKMKGVEIKLHDDKNLTWTTNDTPEERRLDKTLGYTKFHINEKFGIKLQLIKIDRKQRTIKIRTETGNKLVMKPTDNNDDEEDYTYMHEAAEVKPAVKAAMKIWLKKFDRDDDDL